MQVLGYIVFGLTMAALVVCLIAWCVNSVVNPKTWDKKVDRIAKADRLHVRRMS